MLDKIEVETEYQAGNLKFRVTAVGDTLVTGYWEDNDEEEVSVSKAGAISFWEPLPSPESPVDDVIWEEAGSDIPYVIKRDGSVWVREETLDAVAPSSSLPILGKAYADLYARLNPPLPKLPDGEWERVEHPKDYSTEFLQPGDLIFHDGVWSQVDPSSGDWHIGCCYGMANRNGWVMRRKTTTVEEWPKIGDRYFTASPAMPDWCEASTWGNDSVDREWKERGLIFKTEEEAIAKAKKMVEGVGK